MGDIVYGVNTKVVFYFKDHTRSQLDPIIQNSGSVLNAANALVPKIQVQLVVDIITNANEIQGPQVANVYSGRPLLEFAFTGFNPVYEQIRYTIPIDLKKIGTAFLSTDVIFRDDQVPVEDLNSNNIAVVPPSENEVISLAKDE